MNITENKKMIAEFMGYEWYKINEPYIAVRDLNGSVVHFHTDWNALMPVIEKILDISLNLDTMEMYYNITDCIPNITHTHIAVTEFIKWYNENKK